MPVHYHKTLVVHSVGSQEVAIWTHGGYTPRRGLYPGSGTTSVPGGMTLHFYTDDDHVFGGRGASRFIVGKRENINPAETARENEVVRNYSLIVESQDNKNLDGLPAVDYVTTRPDEKAHLKDVWAAKKALNLDWKVVHYFACRVNKKTYKGEVTPPTVDPELFFRIHGRYPD